tara:strand:+ start:2199 stop:2513 length:315 start_codon:yes stop_codon:yes gene_type:complete
MNRLKTLEILDKLLVDNDKNISKIILSYIEEKCFVCWRNHLKLDMVSAYCDEKYQKLYMNICHKCKDAFEFKECYICKRYVDKSKTYFIGALEDFPCCQYCAWH